MHEHMSTPASPCPQFPSRVWEATPLEPRSPQAPGHRAQCGISNVLLSWERCRAKAPGLCHAGRTIPRSPFLSSIPTVGRGKEEPAHFWSCICTVSSLLSQRLGAWSPPPGRPQPWSGPRISSVNPQVGRLRGLWDCRLWGRHLSVTFFHFSNPIFLPPPSRKPGDIASVSVFPSLSVWSYITYFLESLLCARHYFTLKVHIPHPATPVPQLTPPGIRVSRGTRNKRLKIMQGLKAQALKLDSTPIELCGLRQVPALTSTSLSLPIECGPVKTKRPDDVWNFLRAGSGMCKHHVIASYDSTTVGNIQGKGWWSGYL